MHDIMTSWVLLRLVTFSTSTIPVRCCTMEQKCQKKWWNELMIFFRHAGTDTAATSNKITVFSAHTRTTSTRWKKPQGAWTQECKDCLSKSTDISWSFYRIFIPALKNVFCLFLLHLDVWPSLCKMMYMQSLFRRLSQLLKVEIFY